MRSRVYNEAVIVSVSYFSLLSKPSVDFSGNHVIFPATKMVGRPRNKSGNYSERNIISHGSSLSIQKGQL